ncbi:TauD/TfdA family dioxygenase [Nonomuraea jiangxiensis]|uniref:Taurine catabolism dioxygenase TauD, TfdA family n=1 Tax=Nonomuraea jiangxiensis TaxID=633440 RepID=A0A1G9BXY8_9ACTN|nr:TauD/TfdA family dioxygenase [Nonomuraea jiangxiensis]SDK44318.1 Taurine catabolism dioxygenase TauD, TfdA family [Nonomuraea jiangxiensis]
MSTIPIRRIDHNRVMKQASALLAEHQTVSDPEFLRDLPAAADDLGELRPPEPGEDFYVLRGLRVPDDELGPTPPGWAQTDRQRTAAWDAVMLLLAAALGRPFGWHGQQAGRLVHDIVPGKGHETEQTGASSTVDLAAHNEDAFHPGRANIMLLGCLRNPDHVTTRAARVRDTRLATDEIATLSRPALPILPDDAYAEAQPSPLEPTPMRTLWHREDGLCLRFDPAYTPLEQAEDAFMSAYERLAGELDRVSVGVPLEPGDVLVIDNDTVVHGREPFRARYDGTDRWLKRVNVRVPGRERPGERGEHGYGQRTIEPYQVA